jgi:RimJ/RimL family protein N-acetyltransferase
LPIETDRLILRDFQAEDWVQVHAYARDPEVVRYQDWGPNSEEETRAFVDRAMATGRERPRKVYELAVVFKPTGTLVGGAALRLGDQDPLCAELGYTLHRLAWGQGLGTELARALVQFGFQHLEVRRVWAKCRPENIGSYRVLKKVGLRFEEYIQNDGTIRGRLVDSFLCGLTRQEWLRSHSASARPGTGC